MRLSIDSDFAAGPKNKKLARVLGLNRLHTAGCCLEVWSACYIGRTCYLTIDEVDNAAEIDGFAESMIAAGLAESVEAGHTTTVELVLAVEVVPVILTAKSAGVRIDGAAERIDYLLKQAEKSRRGVEAKKERARQRTNPPPVAGYPAGQPAGNPRVANCETADAPAQPAGNPAGQPMGSPAGQPARVNPDPPDPDLAPDRSGNSLAPRAPTRTIPPTPVGRTERWYRAFSEARLKLAAELGIPDVLPFPLITPAKLPRGYRDLSDRLGEEGDNADAVATRVLEVLVAAARENPEAFEWVSDKAFTEGGWRNARDRVPGWRGNQHHARKPASVFDALDEAAERMKASST